MTNDASTYTQQQTSQLQHEMEASLRAELIALGYDKKIAETIRCKIRGEKNEFTFSLFDPSGELRHNTIKNFKEKVQNSHYGLPNSSQFFPGSIYFPDTVIYDPTSLEDIVTTVNKWVRPEFAVSIPSQEQTTPQMTIQATDAELHPKIKAALEIRSSRLPFDQTTLVDCKEKIETALKAELLAKDVNPQKVNALKFDVSIVGPERDTIQLSINQSDVYRELVLNHLAMDKGWEGTFRPAYSSRRVEPSETHYFNAETFEDLLNSVNNWVSPENKIDTRAVLGKGVA